jgi:hypothetical protein
LSNSITSRPGAAVLSATYRSLSYRSRPASPADLPATSTCPTAAAHGTHIK